ncbi:hypothetical protein F5888DRAFT_1853248 [Russula emetica]|nr:hypothetical protein F5888DRAFT_1853248 [Russula emetica]
MSSDVFMHVRNTGSGACVIVFCCDWRSLREEQHVDLEKRDAKGELWPVTSRLFSTCRTVNPVRTLSSGIGGYHVKSQFVLVSLPSQLTAAAPPPVPRVQERGPLVAFKRVCNTSGPHSSRFRRRFVPPSIATSQTPHVIQHVSVPTTRSSKLHLLAFGRAVETRMLKPRQTFGPHCAAASTGLRSRNRKYIHGDAFKLCPTFLLGKLGVQLVRDWDIT